MKRPAAPVIVEDHVIDEQNVTVRYTAGDASIEQLLMLQQVHTEAQWAAHGRNLGQAERVLGWAVGNWWNAGEKYGSRVAIVTSPAWDGPAYRTCRQYGSIAARYPLSGRLGNLTFEHHAAVVALPAAERAEVLALASRQAEETGSPPSVKEMRQLAKTRRRTAREEELGESTAIASRKLGRRLYSVIYADPPWRFEPRSHVTGMDRAADNHYPTMDKGQLEAIHPPSASNCILFMWATVPMLEHALDLMRHWNFEYRSHMVWTKPRAGTGYWFRIAHELLLVGVKGKIPAPAPGFQRLSWFQASRGRHSEKPDCVYTIIEQMFPTQLKLEMFAREQREGWDQHGNEVNNG